MVNPIVAKEIADTIWNEPELIDEYLEKHPDLDERKRNILKSWKRCESGLFLIERFLKKGTIFINGSEVYLVQGLKSSYEEIFIFEKLPILVRATLLPFENVIVTDGLLRQQGITFGSGIKKSMKEVYINAKNNGSIHTTL